jgi:RNA polymerase sigma factor (TIGR02999 family)
MDRLVSRVHAELRKIARGCMAGERAGHTLQPTALINEAYLRLVDMRQVDWQSRSHFLAMSARVMRRVLVDMARARNGKKRDGGARVTFDEGLAVTGEPAQALLALDDALEALAKQHPRKSQVIELRFFGGLTEQEAAGVLNVSPDTVTRDWRFAKAWLQRELRRSTADGC